MLGGSSGFAERTCALPRLSGWRLMAAAVKAGKGSRSPPQAARLSGCTVYSTLGVAKRGSVFAKAPTWPGGIDIGPDRVSTYSSAIIALPHREPARVFNVGTP